MLTPIQVINSNSFGVNKKDFGLKPRCICAHLKVSHLYQSIQNLQRISGITNLFRHMPSKLWNLVSRTTCGLLVLRVLLQHVIN